MTEQELLALAKDASKRAYAPFSGFKVGAAVITPTGKVYSGCNIENSSYGATCCAERIALFKAVSEGEKEFNAIAVYGGNGEECTPCGICLQVISELAPNADIILSDNTYKIAELLPKAFKLKKSEDKND